MVSKTCVCRHEIGLKHFDKLQPESGPIRKARPDLQLFNPQNNSNMHLTPGVELVKLVRSDKMVSIAM